jgi:hypothetical protein
MMLLIVLRRDHERAAVLLRERHGTVRAAGVQRLQRPVDVRVVGRHAPDGGSVQGHRRRGAARSVRVPCSYRQDLPSELTASVLRLLMMAGA